MSIHKSISLAGTATVGPKGQVVIPAETRESMGISPGDKLLVLYVEEKNAVSFITEKQAQKYIDQLGKSILEVKSKLKSQE